MRAEIAGILHHEMTHMYQNDDKPEATFSGMARMYEGIADAVRIRNGFTPLKAAPSNKSGSWQDKTYTGQAFFWLYVDHAHPGFLHTAQRQHERQRRHPLDPRRDPEDHGQDRRSAVDRVPGAACCQGPIQTCCR